MTHISLPVPGAPGSPGSVTSVAGRVGNVALTRADVGLDRVDNTPDLGKPIPTAVAEVLATKLDRSLENIDPNAPVGGGSW